MFTSIHLRYAEVYQIRLSNYKPCVTVGVCSIETLFFKPGEGDFKFEDLSSDSNQDFELVIFTAMGIKDATRLGNIDK